MKKFYNKPTVELVDFSLSTNIAGNCAPGSGDGSDEPQLPLDEVSCGGCYHAPTEDNNVMHS